ncbi:uncharacterized protein LOC117109068 [Anneissia japonica]|uniref:uncharacterized protein LOC117109068 n=1 Tax=Anneissia japonica TaxID=1529436 RepID=UPI001425A843|nr:uncharacterized protein LOC117109068 [Anneissia japonica]XP_033107196.1 uncharacterized protein LOC117109068 [Anneissia japonica]XP_033107197.1 uncharacterized protein LOC117109068 [Anneissia japonica]XP_033107198.1 uncharacterized protein LOC117109068 [Anneissia japonica]XP_033107199.1 uncharacterized protein LOC117109068 [Anneissia japonica]XP_033107200.1 uncharacterized protein LOC117109068 [Anneissia japonica]XP_033107201.1 uncharacterized protein LOC117109068 [Anneissia japonica]
MMPWCIRGGLAFALILLTFLSHECSSQNTTNENYFSTIEYQSTDNIFNSSIIQVTNNENVDNVTAFTQMTPNNVTTESNISHMTEIMESSLEPSPSWEVMYTSYFETSYFLESYTITSEDLYFSSLILSTPKLRPTQSSDMTSIMTEYFEGSNMFSTNIAKTSNDFASFAAVMETSSLPLLPVTTSSDIPMVSPSSVIVPSSSLAVVSTSALTVAVTTSPEGPTKSLKDFKFTMKMNGNCDNVKSDEDLFKKACIDAITERTGVIKNQLMINDLRCGSVVLDFTFYDKTEEDNGAEMLEMASEEEPLIISFKGEEYVVVEVTEVSLTPTKSSGGLSIEDQRLLIYCVAGGLCGFVVLLAICLCISQCCKNRHKKRKEDILFQGEHLTKLSDMNLTTTIIPRPKSIYGNIGNYETRCSLFAITNNYYYYNNGAFMFDDESDPNSGIMTADGEGEGGVMVAVEVNEPTTPGAKASEQFGMSGIPDWNLPQLEGVVRAGKDIEGSDTASIHDFSRPSSRTFSIPLPPPPPQLPNHQEATDVTDITITVPQWNRQSDAFSEITESSLNDTNMLLREGSQRKKVQGLENEGLQLDEDIGEAKKDNTLTRNEPGSQLAPYEALSRL